MSAALLIIDMQSALCTGEEAAFGIEAVIEKVNDLGRRARASHTPVILVQHEEDGGPLAFRSAGWELAAGLVTASEDIRVRKKTPNSFFRTALHDLLQERGVSSIVVCGLQTEFCVDTTVRQALALGYHVVLAGDAHSTTDGVISAQQTVAHHNRTLGYMGGFDSRVAVKPAAEVTFTGWSAD